MRCLCVLISSMVVVAGCMLSNTGTATVMLLSVGDISSRGILSIVSASKIGFSFSGCAFLLGIAPVVSVY